MNPNNFPEALTNETISLLKIFQVAIVDILTNLLTSIILFKVPLITPNE